MEIERPSPWSSLRNKILDISFEPILIMISIMRGKEYKGKKKRIEVPVEEILKRRLHLPIIVVYFEICAVSMLGMNVSISMHRRLQLSVRRKYSKYRILSFQLHLNMQENNYLY